jgi:(R,R)-butanediol dehydrogenase/meso-butanediol dehydrogenase/diacetyl reductase
MLRPGHILGHEFCGTVAEVGKGVGGWKADDRVIGGGGTPPSGVPQRISAAPRYSAKTVGLGDVTSWGGYAEYVAMDAWRLLPTPDNVSDETATLAEPLSVAVHTVRLSRLHVGDRVAILGAGAIGLLMLQVVQASGAGRLYVSEPAPARQKAARQLGVDHVLDPAREDVVAALVKETDGLGPDIIFDCAGASGTLQQSLEAVRRQGQVVAVSLNWKPDPVLTVEWVGREVELKAAYGASPEDWRIGVDLMRKGRIDSKPLLPPGSIVPLDAIQDAFMSLLKPSQQVQLVVAP